MNLEAEQKDALKELINIGVGRAAAVLNGMMEAHIRLAVPDVKLVNRTQLMREIDAGTGSMISAVRLGFKGPFTGVAALVFPVDSAAKLVSVLVGDDDTEADMDSVRTGTLTEVGNIVMNGVMGSMGNVLHERIDYSVPTYVEALAEHVISAPGSSHDEFSLLAEARFSIEELSIDGGIVLFFEIGSFDALVASIDNLIEVQPE